MLKIIKMNLFRLFKMKALYIVIGILFGVCALIAVANRVSQENGEAVDHTTEISETDTDGTYSVSVDASNTADDGNVWNSLLNMIEDGSLQLIIIILIVLYAVNDYSTGYTKNIATIVNGRYKLVIAKFISIIVISLICYLVFSIFFIFSFSLVVKGVTYALSLKTLGLMALSFAHMIAFGTIVLAVVELTRAKSIAMVCAICLSTGMIGILGSLLNLLIKPDNIIFNDYFVTNNMLCISNELGNSDIVKMLTCVAAAIVVYFTVSVISISKKDIN